MARTTKSSSTGKTQAKAKTASKAAVRKGGGLLPEAMRPEPPKATKAAKREGYQAYALVSKASLSRVPVSQMPRKLPDLKSKGVNKDSQIANWLKTWITDGLAKGTLSEANLLPRKADLAKYLDVSVGTVQNAIRYVEDEGFVESKQRIGTIIRSNRDGGSRLRKQVSKRDQAVVAIRQMLHRQNFEKGDTLPSAREIAKSIGSAPNTTRLALEYLCHENILESLGTRGNKANWMVLRVLKAGETQLEAPTIESETLIDQLERDLKRYIAEKLDESDKLPSHLELAEQFKVSIKTVHDTMKRLVEQGIVHSKRGRYGTYVLRKPDPNKIMAPSKARKMFVPAKYTASFYNYEKVEQHLKQLIAAKHKVGDKLDPMGEIAKKLDVSSNTIRKALQNLANEGYVSFSRGRYGGTFVNKLPKVDTKKTMRWVSINPETIRSYRSPQRKAKV